MSLTAGRRYLLLLQGGTWSGGLTAEEGSGVITQAFLVPSGFWLAWEQGGRPVWPPSLRCPWGFHCHPGGFPGSAVGQPFCPAC